MKNILILISFITLVAFTTKSKAAEGFVVGELVNEGESIALYTKNGRLEVHAEETLADCFEGQYAIKVEPKGTAMFKVVETISCRGKGKGMEKNFNGNNKSMCPMVYAPACGSVNGFPKTFGNLCELKNANAKKLFLGACEEGLSSGVRAHQEVNSVETVF